ncbi:MAG: alpha/beta hydrolase [Bacilli bacterium]|nr:alpha/beta hydrolase [Bacilli bacterium]MDD4808534.1 alpha/beta hydrolase [Bacilli bacterium]
MDINGTYINYVQYGNKKGRDVVLLHGWGQSIATMDPIGQGLKDQYYITLFDFPGFGDSPEPSYGYTVYDYEELLNKLLIKLKIDNPILISHSFGGRIGMIYASKRPVSKLVLMATPFRRTNKKANYKLRILKIVRKTPILKKLEGYVKKKIASSDYAKASPIMRKVLVNVINENLSSIIPKIKAQTILIWGSKDEQVPLSEAKYIENNIKDAGLIVYDNAGHFAYLERLDQTINILKSFLRM